MVIMVAVQLVLICDILKCCEIQYDDIAQYFSAHGSSKSCMVTAQAGLMTSVRLVSFLNKHRKSATRIQFFPAATIQLNHLLQELSKLTDGCPCQHFLWNVGTVGIDFPYVAATAAV